jgi:hypothetical protein
MDFSPTRKFDMIDQFANAKLLHVPLQSNEKSKQGVPKNKG